MDLKSTGAAWVWFILSVDCYIGAFEDVPFEERLEDVSLSGSASRGQDRRGEVEWRFVAGADGVEASPNDGCCAGANTAGIVEGNGSAVVV